MAIDSSQLILKVKWFKKNEKFHKGMYKQITICMFIQSHMIFEMVMWYSHDLLKISCDWYPCLFSLFFLNNVFDLSHQCVHVYEEHGGWNGETNSRWTERERVIYRDMCQPFYQTILSTVHKPSTEQVGNYCIRNLEMPKTFGHFFSV